MNFSLISELVAIIDVVIILMSIFAYVEDDKRGSLIALMVVMGINVFGIVGGMLR